MGRFSGCGGGQRQLPHALVRHCIRSTARMPGPRAPAPRVRLKPMRSHATALPPAQPPTRGDTRSDWATLRKLFPYLWRYRWRVAVALGFMVAAKLANVGVPVLLKELVDGLSVRPATPRRCSSCRWGCCWPMAGCGCPRRCSPSCANWSSPRPPKARRAASRWRSSATCMRLSLRFHLERQTGGMTRDIERGTRAVHSLISYSLYSILPTLIEVTLVLDHPGHPVRHRLRLDHAGGAGAVRGLHHHRDRMAHQIPPPDERIRLGGAQQGHRRAAQLRDGEVLQQRGLRDPALRPEPGAAAPRRAEEPEHAEHAQRRAAAHHRHRAGGHAVARHARRGGGPA